MSAHEDPSVDQTTQPRLFSWPPNPALTSAQITLRFGLLLNSIIGTGLCFGAFDRGWDHPASTAIGGSFMIVSMLLTPLLLLWNIRLLRGKKISPKSYQQLPVDEDLAPINPRIAVLKLATTIDLLGFCAFLVMLPVMMNDRNYGWGGSETLTIVAALSAVYPIAAHLALFMTQAIQLRGAIHRSRKLEFACPHCNHSMQIVSSARTSLKAKAASLLGRTGKQVRLGATETEEVTEDLLANEAPTDVAYSYKDEDFTADTSSGQITGTCAKTPRASEQRPRAESSTANETGEAEGDRLIEKSE